MAKKIGAGGEPQNYDESNGQYEKDIYDHYKWAVENGFISSLIDLSTYKKIYRRLNKIAIGKKAADGTIIKHITFHCLDRVCGTTEKPKGIKHEGVDLKDFEDTLFNGRVRKLEKTNTIIFISKKCKIANDPTTGVIKQCNRL